MKITPKQYAKTLFLSLQTKNEKEAKATIEKFVGILRYNNHISKTDEIANEFDKIWNEENGILEAEVVSARELSSADLKDISEYIKRAAGASEVIIINKIDVAILGGVIIKYRDKVVDNSLKTKLENLRGRMKK